MPSHSRVSRTNKKFFTKIGRVFLQARSHKLKLKKKHIFIRHWGDHMRTIKHGVDIDFLIGAQMEDEFGLLTGRGKVMRALSLASIIKAQIEYYINQAIGMNCLKK